jgi:ABC-type transport system substrate-binding protein
LKTVIAFIIFFTLCSNAYSQLKIGVSNISKLSHLEINSVREYVIFDDLLRSLIKFDSNGELAADLAESWEIKDQYKKFVLKIKPNEYFSDHSLITVNDVAKSLQNIMSNPSIIHGDGKKIKRVSILSNTKLEIELFESNPFFLTELSSPEYRIVKLSEKRLV